MGPAYDKGTSIISGPLDLQLKFPNLLFSRGGHFQASRVSFEGQTYCVPKPSNVRGIPPKDPRPPAEVRYLDPYNVSKICKKDTKPQEI